MPHLLNRKDTKRNAVIVIHGIGEQLPMTTLRNFVESVLDEKPGSNTPLYYSKPDPFSKSFELRCLATPGNTRPRTDFFEFYWQNLMPQAQWSKIFDWAWFMMNRSVKTVPSRFYSIWWILWIGVVTFCILTLVSLIYAGFHAQERTETLIKIPFGIAAIWLFLQGLFLSYVGDAVTYLRAHPRNIAVRHEIRSAGVSLLNSLHRSRKYDRIIVVGHSLGSIIGYDILNFAWQQYCDKHGYPERPQRDSLSKAESLAVYIHKMIDNGEEIPKALRDEWMDLTKKVGRELRINNHSWLVTNFVTLGSPLAHADLLLAKSRRDLKQKIEQREFPVSPPVVDQKGTFAKAIIYKIPDGSHQTTFVPHHAAWTACVRWTNLYFPCHWLLKGDFVGGPLSPLFGSGVQDVPVSTKIRGGWFSHTYYWAKDHNNNWAESNSIRNLRLALDLQGKGYSPIDREDAQ